MRRWWLETGTSDGSLSGTFLFYFKGKTDKIFYKAKGEVREKKSLG